MDLFGIGPAMTGTARIYFQSARHTGRTQALIEAVKDGDRICFTSEREARRVVRLIKERGINVDYIVADPKTPDSLFQKGTGQGRTILDHSWVEEYFLRGIENMQKDIDYFETQLSGYGATHRKTKRQAEELAKWNI